LLEELALLAAVVAANHVIVQALIDIKVKVAVIKVAV
jgi:hypothetical protein